MNDTIKRTIIAGVISFLLSAVMIAIFYYSGAWESAETSSVTVPGIIKKIGAFKFLLIAGVIAPIAEELIFRGLIPWVSYKFHPSKHIAIWSSSILWAFGHGLSPIKLIFITLEGLNYGYLRAGTKSLMPSLALHTIHNSVAIGALVIGGGFN